MRSNITGTGHQGGMKMPPLKYLLMAAGAIAVVGAAAAISVVALNSGGSGKPLEAVIAETPTPIVATATPYSTATPTLTPYPTATATPFPTATATATATATVVPPSPTPPSSPTPQQPTAVPSTVTPIPPTVTATVVAGFTDAQLRQKLSGLVDLLDTKDTILDANGNDSKGYLQKLKDIAEPLYFTAMGKTFDQNNIEVHYVTKKQQEDFLRSMGITIDENFLLPGSMVLPGLNTSTGKYISHVLIRTDINNSGRVGVTVSSALISLIHELGHATARLVDKDRIGSDYNSAALNEAQAYTFESFAWRNAEQYLGKQLIGKRRNTPQNVSIINTFWGNVQSGLGKDFHEEGYFVPWLAIFEDPNLSDLKEELVAKKQLSVSSRQRLFEYLITVAKTDQQAHDYVAKSMIKAPDRFQEITRLTRERLISQDQPETGTQALFYNNSKHP